jgi:hypothetical protein
MTKDWFDDFHRTEDWFGDDKAQQAPTLHAVLVVLQREP